MRTERRAALPRGREHLPEVDLGPHLAPRRPANANTAAAPEQSTSW